MSIGHTSQPPKAVVIRPVPALMATKAGTAPPHGAGLSPTQPLPPPPSTTGTTSVAGVGVSPASLSGDASKTIRCTASVSAFWTAGRGEASIAFDGDWSCNSNLVLQGTAELTNTQNVVAEHSCDEVGTTCHAASTYFGPEGEYKAAFSGYAYLPAGRHWTDAGNGCTIENSGTTLDCVELISFGAVGP
jgi:hypothetical protein